MKVCKSKEIVATSHYKWSDILGYYHRFKRRLHKTHPNIWSFIDSIRREVHIVHNLIFQIDCRMQPREKRTQSKTVERRIKELYNRCDNNEISIDQILQKLSLYVANEK